MISLPATQHVGGMYDSFEPTLLPERAAPMLARALAYAES